MHVLSYGENIWLKQAEIKINFKLGFKGLNKLAQQSGSNTIHVYMCITCL